MSETFTNKLTIKGQQKKAVAEANNTGLNITTFQVGDGNGTYYEPTENQTLLKNTKYTGTFTAGTQSQIIINPSATNEVLYKCFIPADIGGFTIRELGLFDNDGDLILICKLPAQDKFVLSSGIYQPLTFTPKIIYTNPQINANLTPTSQIVPTTADVINMITEYSPQVEFLEPLNMADGGITLDFDETLKINSGKLGVNKANLTQNFCINSGNINNGNADILAYSGTTLSFKIDTGIIYQPLVLTYADKSQETLTNLIDVTGLSTNGTYTVLKEKTSSIAVYLFSIKITQGKTFPISPSNGDYHCLTTTDLKTYKRVNGAWIETQYVVLGTVTVANNVITAVTTKSYNQNGYDINIQTQGYRFPDYTNGINKACGMTHIAESDGKVLVQYGGGGSASQTGSYTFKINNVSLLDDYTSNAYSGVATIFDITKGETFIGTYSGINAKEIIIFYPLKGAN